MILEHFTAPREAAEELPDGNSRGRRLCYTILLIVDHPCGMPSAVACLIPASCT